MTAVVSTLNIHKGDDFALRQSLWIDSVALTPGGAAVAVTAPTNAKYVLFSAQAGKDFYMLVTPKSGGSAVAAVVPTTTTTDGSSPELNPAMRMLPDNGGSFMSIISPTTNGTGIITLQYFGLA
jgi:hypothetical protein